MSLSERIFYENHVKCLFYLVHTVSSGVGSILVLKESVRIKPYKYNISRNEIPTDSIFGIHADVLHLVSQAPFA